MHTTKKSIYTIELSEDEAAWLRGAMQNPLWNETPDTEDPIHQEMRFKIFNTLDYKELRR